jgi:hypothetical protein
MISRKKLVRIGILPLALAFVRPGQPVIPIESIEGVVFPAASAQIGAWGLPSTRRATCMSPTRSTT